MNRQEQTEVNHLKKVNKDLRKKIDSFLIGLLKKEEECDIKQLNFIWLWINLLIENEIEQESYCDK
jgi:hypothetical protein